MRRNRTGLVAAAALLAVAGCNDAPDDDGSGDTSGVAQTPVTSETVIETPTETGAGHAPATEAPPVSEAPPVTESAVATDPPMADNTLVWVATDEPSDLNPYDPDRTEITSWIVAPLLEGLYGVTESMEFFPELLAADASLTENADGSVTADYTLREGLTWSDGDDLTADDVAWTLDVVLAADDAGDPNFVFDGPNRIGFDLIADSSVQSDTQFSITWSAFDPGWRTLLSEVLPMHVFSADPAAAAAELAGALAEWNHNGSVIPSSGPLIFDSWERGKQLNLDRNDNYHGSVSPDVTRQGQNAAVDGVQIKFLPDVEGQIDGLRAGDAPSNVGPDIAGQIDALLTGQAHIVFSPADPAYSELADSDDFTVASSPGVVFDHWGLNVNNEHLGKTDVREALAFAMNKGEVVTELYEPLFGDILPAEGLGNTYWLSNNPNYENHTADAGYGTGDIAAAQASLEAAGYVRNADGVYEHPDDGVLSLRVGTPSGNRLREIQQELIRQQMADAGINVEIDNIEGPAYFGAAPFSAEAIACSRSGGAEGDCGIWDITQFPLIGSPDPYRLHNLYRSGSFSNPYGYAQPFFDQLAEECDTIIDDDLRAACYNELDRHVTTLDPDFTLGLVVIPISQVPTFYGHTNDLEQAAVAPDANGAGPLANVVDFVFVD